MSNNNRFVKWSLLTIMALDGLYGLRLLYLSLKGIVKYGAEMSPAVYIRSYYLLMYLVITACVLAFSRVSLIRGSRDVLFSTVWIVLTSIFVAVSLLSVMGIIGTMPGK